MKKQSSNEPKKAVSGKDREKIGKKVETQKIQTSRWTGVFFDLLLVTLAIAIALGGLDFYRAYENKKAFDLKRDSVKKEIVFWQGIAEKYKDYRDAYFKISLLEYELGNKQRSSYYLQKTLALDPNFEAGRKFEKVLK
ncbi:MAG: hypothetical protein M1268_02540 [Patescibacteria group bacterium]|nr:hypothetical protein [Patescibacteria group bacterium]